jgi:hypothetical protein
MSKTWTNYVNVRRNTTVVIRQDSPYVQLNIHNLSFKRCIKSHMPFANIIRRFNVHGPVHHKHIPIYIQKDATVHSLFISGNCSTCFGWYFHPSSGAHTTVSTASGICQHRYCYLPLSWKSWNWFECAVGGTCIQGRRHLVTAATSVQSCAYRSLCVTIKLASAAI